MKLNFIRALKCKVVRVHARKVNTALYVYVGTVYAFLVLALEKREWSFSHLCLFNPGEIVPITH